ncbi:MAG TPA: acetoacetate decarboxylase family protein [Kofleriaceae bacterium]|nr:acetoacetate decarboxylase family protein [Kofleriaceae bacterium]
MTTFFAGTRPGRAVTTGAVSFDLPVLYVRDDSFQALFSADLRALEAAMPTDRLHPIAVAPGRGIVGIGAFDYLETSVGPYGELGVVVPVVHGRRPPPILPGLLESVWPGFGLLVLHLPVTDRLARDGGRALWGYTKFLASMKFLNTPELHECRLEEAGEHILTLRVVKRGIALPERRPLVTYSVKDGALVRTRIPQRAVALHALGAGGSSLVLGDNHPVAGSIGALGIDPRPIMTRTFLGRTAILPEGEVVERGVRPLDGYLGRESNGRIAHLPAEVQPPS